MDLQYLLLLQQLRTSAPAFVERFFGAVTNFGANSLLILLPCAVYWCIDKKKGQFLFFSMFFSEFAGGFFKLTACIYRPWIRDARIIPSELAIHGATGYSFPSGHAVNAVALGGGLGWIYRKEKPGLWWSMCVLTALILFSRNFLGVHTPQDVIAGALLGAAMIWLTGLFISRYGEDTSHDGRILLIVWAAVAAAIVYYLVKPYPMDYVDGMLLVDPAKMSADSFKSCGSVMGMTLGWYLERRYIRFSVEGSKKQKLLRFVCGTLLLLAVNEVVTAAGNALLPTAAALFLHRFVPLLLAVAGVPALFQWLEQKNSNGNKAQTKA